MEKINIEKVADSQADHLMNHKIALLRDIHYLEYAQNNFFFLESYFVSFIVKGHAEIMIEDEMYKVSAGQVFISTPKKILKNSMFSMDFEMRSLFISPEYVKEISTHSNQYWTLNYISTGHHILQVDPIVMQEALLYYDLLELKLSEPESTQKQSSIDALNQSFFYTLFGMASRYTEVAFMTQNSAQQIFRKFVSLLNDTKVPFMGVNEYAEQIHVTPKYFSAVCKQMVGKSAKTIINEEIMHMAKALLRENQKSIKQIADELNFTNQSHFGTFFRRHAGISPQQFRDNMTDPAEGRVNAWMPNEEETL